MDGLSWWQPVLGFFGLVIVSYFGWLGARSTAAGAKAGADRSADVTAQESALGAWQELLAPYRQEVAQLRAELIEERRDRAEQQVAVEARRKEREVVVQDQVDNLNTRIDNLTDELRHWKRLAKVIARWASTLRDQVIALGGVAPTTPEELLVIQTLDDDDGDKSLAEVFARPKG